MRSSDLIGTMIRMMDAMDESMSYLADDSTIPESLLIGFLGQGPPIEGPSAPQECLS